MTTAPRALRAPALVILAVLACVTGASAAERVAPLEARFRAAREDFLARDDVAAASEIRSAARLVAAAASASSTGVEPDVRASARALGDLAARVRRGDVTEVVTLDRAFGRVRYQLDRQRYLLTQRQRAAGEMVRARRLAGELARAIHAAFARVLGRLEGVFLDGGVASPQWG